MVPFAGDVLMEPTMYIRKQAPLCADDLSMSGLACASARFFCVFSLQCGGQGLGPRLFVASARLPTKADLVG